MQQPEISIHPLIGRLRLIGFVPIFGAKGILEKITTLHSALE